MEKSKVVAEIEAYLQDELAEAKKNQDDLQSSEIQRLLLMYRFLPKREYGKDEVIVPSCLVELQLDRTNAFYFIAPQGGGLVTRVDGQPVQVITPHSPLGEKLLGKKVGEEIEVEIRGGVRKYRIISLS